MRLQDTFLSEDIAQNAHIAVVEAITPHAHGAGAVNVALEVVNKQALRGVEGEVVKQNAINLRFRLKG